MLVYKTLKKLLQNCNSFERYYIGFLTEQTLLIEQKPL